MLIRKDLMYNCHVAALAFMRVAYEIGHAPRSIEEFESVMPDGLHNPFTGKSEPLLDLNDRTDRHERGRTSVMIVDVVDGQGVRTGDIKVEFFGHGQSGAAEVAFEMVLPKLGAKRLRNSGGIH